MSSWRWRWSRWIKDTKQFLQGLLSKRNGYAASVKMCPSCGKLIAAKTQQCEYCKTAVGHVAVSADRGSDRESTSMMETTFAVFGICVFFFTLGAILSTHEIDEGGLFAVLKSYFAPQGGVNRALGAAESNRIFIMGEYWRLATYIFLHGNLIHILFNLSALALLGPLVVHYFGLRRFWLLTLGTGIMGGLISSMVYIWVHWTVGVSGALFGYIGALWGHARKRGDPANADRFMRYMVFGNALMIGITMLGMPVDNICHLGGMFCGMWLGGFMYETAASKTVARVESAVLACCFGLWLWGLAVVLPSTVLAGS